MIWTCGETRRGGEAKIRRSEATWVGLRWRSPSITVRLAYVQPEVVGVIVTGACMADPRLERYETQHACKLTGPLGPTHGQDGIVLRSDHFTAVKFFDSGERYRRELE